MEGIISIQINVDVLSSLFSKYIIVTFCISEIWTRKLHEIMWHKALKMAQCPELHTTTVRAPPLYKMNVSRCDAWWNVINLITHFQTANKCPAKYGPFKTWISRLTKISFILSDKINAQKTGWTFFPLNSILPSYFWRAGRTTRSWRRRGGRRRGRGTWCRWTPPPPCPCLWTPSLGWSTWRWPACAAPCK